MSAIAMEEKALGGGNDGVHQTTTWIEADAQEKQIKIDDDDAVLVKIGKQPKMKRRYNFWTRESCLYLQAEYR